TVADSIKAHAPKAFVIVLTNPLDAMVTLMKQRTGFPKQQVVGMAGVLDSSRYRSFLAAELRVSVTNVQAMVLGGHGDDMVPARSHAPVGGIPVAPLLSAEKLEKIEQRTRQAGGEIVALLKTGSAFYSPASAAIQMADAYLNDRKAILPCAAWLEGEYGLRGLYVGVPVQIGAGGVERVIEIALGPEEKKALETSAGHVRELVEAMGRVAAGATTGLHSVRPSAHWTRASATFLRPSRRTRPLGRYTRLAPVSTSISAVARREGSDRLLSSTRTRISPMSTA